MHKRIILLLIVFTSISGFAQNTQQNSTVLFGESFREGANYILFEKLKYDVDNDGKTDTINLYKIEGWNDPGDFQQLQINYASGQELNVYGVDNWTGLKRDLSKFQSENRLKSDNILYFNLSDTQKLLVLFGYWGVLNIIDLSLPNPTVIFNSEFRVTEINDIDKDGIKEFIGRRSSYEIYGEFNSTSYKGTYSPFVVLTYDSNTFVPDTLLSEKYNQEHYAGFFGLDYSIDKRYNVIYPFQFSKAEPYFEFETYRKYPFTSLRKLQESELTNYNKEELKMMRNEIFAFHGYKFKSADLKKYFSDQKWYKPLESNDMISLNSIEKYNVALIRKIEKE